MFPPLPGPIPSILGDRCLAFGHPRTHRCSRVSRSCSRVSHSCGRVSRSCRCVRRWGGTVGGAADTRGVFLELVVPSRCAGCGEPGVACCERCGEVWGSLGRVSRSGVGVPVFALAPYRGVARRVLLAYKERGRRDLAAGLGRALAEALTELPGVEVGADGVWWVVPVPSRRRAARVRGGAHVLRLARCLAGSLAAEGSAAGVAPALRLDGGVRDSAGLGRSEREANLAGKVRFCAEGAPPSGAVVVLLDDVVTTGATAAACVRELSGRGVAVAAVLALTVAG
jgi:predicted amidophosphoribosyltransferase